MSFECGVPYSNSLLWSDSWFNSEIVFLNNVDLIQRQWKASMFHGMLHSFMFPSVRCGYLGSVFVKISTSVWYGLFHILNVLHRKQTLNMTGKIKSQHILFRSFIPAQYELYAFHDQVICLFAAHSTQILFHDAEFVLCNKMGDLLWTRLRFKLGLLESLVRFFTSYVFSPDSLELTCQFLWSIIATYATGWEK